MDNFFTNFSLFLCYGLIFYCIVGIIMYICSKARPRKRTILLLKVLATIGVTIFFINAFDFIPHFINHYEWLKGHILQIF